MRFSEVNVGDTIICVTRDYLDVYSTYPFVGSKYKVLEVDNVDRMIYLEGENTGGILNCWFHPIDFIKDTPIKYKKENKEN